MSSLCRIESLNLCFSYFYKSTTLILDTRILTIYCVCQAVMSLLLLSKFWKNLSVFGIGRGMIVLMVFKSRIIDLLSFMHRSFLFAERWWCKCLQSGVVFVTEVARTWLLRVFLQNHNLFISVCGDSSTVHCVSITILLLILEYLSAHIETASYTNCLIRIISWSTICLHSESYSLLRSHIISLTVWDVALISWTAYAVQTSPRMIVFLALALISDCVIH